MSKKLYFTVEEKREAMRVAKALKRATPEGKEAERIARKKYAASVKGKAMRRKHRLIYIKTDSWAAVLKKAVAKFNNSEHGKTYNKEKNRKYRESIEGKIYFKEYMASYLKEYRKNNRDKCNAWAAVRKAAKLQAIPKWADLQAIKDVYQEAQYFGYTVDHIVPLRSSRVCGLHVWDNLQLLPHAVNSSKGNRVWPDMSEGS